MRNVRMTISVTVVVVLCFSLPKANATIYFDDGGVHDIDYEINDNISVDYEVLGMETRINWLEGASLPDPYGLWTYGDSYVNILGGSISNYLFAYDYSQVAVSGGSIYELYAKGISSVTVSGGSINGSLFAYNSSQVILSGGSIANGLYAKGSSQVTVSGGSINGSLFASDSSQVKISRGSIGGWVGAYNSSQVILSGGSIGAVNAGLIAYNGGQIIISGGSIEGKLIPQDNSILTIHGSDFAVNGVTFGYGELTSILGGSWLDEPYRHLTGILTSGDLLDNGFYIGHDASIVLIPEPGTPPVADAGGPYSVYVGDAVTLDGSGSTDDDNDIVSYMWDLDDDENFETDAGDQPVFDVNYTYLVSLGLLVDVTYDIHVKVTDSESQSDVNDSTLIIIPKPVTVVAVDIKPGSCPNPVNVKSSGVLPIAILGTDDYDVTTIDPTSIRLAGVEPLRSSFEDVAGPVSDGNDCNCITEGADGFLDLTLKFKTQRIVEAVGDVNDGDVRVLTLTGVLFDPMPFETPIEGADCILIRGKHKPINPADINKDGVVDVADFAIFAQNWLQSSIVDE